MINASVHDSVTQLLFTMFIDSPYPSEGHRLADLYTLLFGGHDTTSNSIVFIMMEVARHPEVLREIQKEIDAVGLYTDQPFQIDDLAQLVYLDQVIKEGMRLWPVGALGAGRKAEIDYEYKDMVIPKGCSISVYFIIMFRLGIQVLLKFISLDLESHIENNSFTD